MSDWGSRARIKELEARIKELEELIPKRTPHPHYCDCDTCDMMRRWERREREERCQA